jgi:hypothetical protein
MDHVAGGVPPPTARISLYAVPTLPAESWLLLMHISLVLVKAVTKGAREKTRTTVIRIIGQSFFIFSGPPLNYD